MLKVDEEEFGGHGALLQEGLFASITLFVVLEPVFNPIFITIYISEKQRMSFTLLESPIVANIFFFLSCFFCYVCTAFLDRSLQFGSLLMRASQLD